MVFGGGGGERSSVNLSYEKSSIESHPYNFTKIMNTALLFSLVLFSGNHLEGLISSTIRSKEIYNREQFSLNILGRLRTAFFSLESAVLFKKKLYH